MTITNSIFGTGSTAQPDLVAVSPCGGVAVTYSTFNDNDVGNTTGGMIDIDVNGAGTFTMEYCLLLNANTDYWDMGQTTEVFRYNVLSGHALLGGHPDWLQTSSGLYNIDLEFNTVYALSIGTGGLGSQGYSIAENGGTAGNSTFAYNTTVAQAGANISFNFAVNTSNVTGAVTHHDNYADATGSSFGFTPNQWFAKAGSSCNPCGGGGTSTFNHNVNMVDGSLFPTNP